MDNKTKKLDANVYDPDPDRGRGILTPHDRAFLRAAPREGVRKEMEPNGSAERQKRHKIRKRFRNALIDIQYLLLIDDVDYARLFPYEDWEEEEIEEVRRSVLVAVFYLAHFQSDSETVFQDIIDTIGAERLDRYVNQHGVVPEGTIRVEIDNPPLEECTPVEDVLSAYKDGEELSFGEHRALEFAGMHPDPDAY